MLENDKNLEGLQRQLRIVKPTPPNFLQIDDGLWKACLHSSNHPHFVGKELSFVQLGPELTRMLSRATLGITAQLAGNGTCSFFPLVTAEQILATFDYGERWLDMDFEYHSHYCRMRFALTYWLSVRDVADYSKSHCASFFCLDDDVVNTIAETSISNVVAFCNGNPQLHQFSLTCPVDDCMDIIRIATDETFNESVRECQMTAARLRKEQHCCEFSGTDFAKGFQHE